MSRITLNSNIEALRAGRQLSITTRRLSDSFNRLSSGLRINKAADDAAGLQIAEDLKFNTKIANQGVRNISDGISLYNIAEGNLEELTNIVSRIQELAAQASNGSYGKTQRKALDNEAQALSKEFSRIRNSATFNGFNLLTGELTDVAIQAGQGAEATIVGNVGGAVGTGDFNLSTTLIRGHGVKDIDSADLNGDGNLDLVVGGKNTSSSVYLGDGTGNFSDPLFFNDSETNDVEIGDFNGDGVLDLVYVGSGARGNIRLGNGDGTFKEEFSVNVSPTFANHFTIADFDGDGKEDLLNSSENINIYFGNGDGTLKAASNIVPALGTTIWNRAEDFNGDGVIDLAYKTDSSNLSIIMGNGDGTFHAATSYGVVGSIGELEIGDFNQDGISDIVVFGLSGTAFNILVGNADGSFKTTVTYGSGVVRDIEIVDLNGDGISDIATRGSIHFGNGDASFRLATDSYSSPLFNARTFGDFNGDGAIDTAYNSSSNVIVETAVTTSGVSSLASFSLETLASARQAFALIGKRGEQLSRQKGEIGAFQSRLDVAFNTLKNSALSFQEAESRIRDADIATEAAEQTRLSILQQSAVLILSKANTQPEIALSLLGAR